MENSIKMEAETDDIVSPEHSEEQELKPSNLDTTNIGNTVSTTAKEVCSRRPKNSIFKRKPRHFKDLTYIQKPHKEEFSLYLKKRFLNFFCEKGCTPETLAMCLDNYKVDADEVKEYFSKAAKEAQQFIHQECNSLSFNNINEWLKYMQTIGAPEECNYETAIVTNAIANNEKLPEPETIGGINLKSVYKYLSNALMGLPLPALDPASEKFLSNEFKNLINEANTDSADIDVLNMKTKIETMLSTTKCPQPSSLDPLNINDDNELDDDPTETKFKYTNNVKIEK